jgi:hypothetical protein
VAGAELDGLDGRAVPRFEAAIAFAARRGWRYEMGGSDAAAPGKR